MEVREAAVLLMFSVAGAQIAAAQQPKFELSVNTGNTNPPVVVQDQHVIRTPVTFSELPDTHDLWLTGVDVRWYWMERLSVVFQAALGNTPRHDFSFIQGPTAPGGSGGTFAVTQTVERHEWTASLLQSVDLIARGHVRPWVGGGLMVIHAVDRDHFVRVSVSNPADRSDSVEDTDRSATALVAEAGIRIYLGPKVFLSADESVRGYLGETPLGTFNALWRVGFGFGF